MPDHSNQARGRWGETLAARHYARLGFTVVAARWRPPDPDLRGDLDLVLRRDDLLVFCEVKARRDAERFGGAVAAVTPAKQAQVRRLAERWIHHHGGSVPGFEGVRFDVVAIDGRHLTHYESAF